MYGISCAERRFEMKRPIKNTKNSHLSPAEICRRNGWGPGTWIEGLENQRTDKMRITAVGERRVLAIEEGAGELWETILDLDCRNWKRVGENHGEK